MIRDFDRAVSTISVEVMDSCRNPDVLLENAARAIPMQKLAALK